MPIDVILVTLLLAPFLATMIFLPAIASAKFFRLSKPSRLWVRLLGICAAIWLVLMVMTTTDPITMKFSKNTHQRLLSLRHLFIGVTLGLFIAINTKHREDK